MSMALGLAFAPVALSQTVFSGISSMEARPGADGFAQVITFQADLPFQYQKQVLDADTVVLRLYNARLARNLITPEGGVNLLTGGVVNSARIKHNAANVGASDGVQEIILTGPGLGGRPIRILGGEELSSHPVVTAPSTHMMMARAPHAAHGKGSSQKKATIHNFINLRTLTAAGTTPINAVNGRIRDDNHLAGPAQPVAYPAIAEAPRIELAESPAVTNPPILKLSPGPKIMEISGAPTQNGIYTGGPNGSADVASSEATPSQVYNGDFSSTVNALPRYQGGAKPIEAMTTDNQGHPILIRPKNQPIPEFSVNSRRDGGYNTLFQAETTDVQQRIGLFLSDALAAYKANQFAQAQKQVERALMLDASNADLLAALAEIQLKQGQPGLAEQNYQKAQERSPEKYGSRYAQLLTTAGKRKEAIQVLEALYRQNPKQAQVAYMLGTLNEELGQTAQALTYLQQAAQLHPASADIQYNLGLAYELSGDRERAEKHYRQALSLSPTAKDVIKALARVR
jgi:Flp pilus assembly protein TadD